MTKSFGILLVLLLCGCADMQTTLPFPLNENGHFEKASRETICQRQKALAAATADTVVSPKSQGMIVFDGTVIAAEILPKEKQEITMDVDSILFGGEYILPEKLKLISPMERHGGITVIMGEQYRVNVLPLNQKYYTWAALGTAPKDPIFGSIHSCNDR